VPIYNKDEQARKRIDDIAHIIIAELKGKGIRVKYDNDDAARPGWKFCRIRIKGMPVRYSAWARDIETE